MEVRTNSEVTPPTGLSNTVTIIAIVCGVVAVAIVLAVAAIIIAGLKFVLKSCRRKTFDLGDRYMYIIISYIKMIMYVKFLQVLSITVGDDK